MSAAVVMSVSDEFLEEYIGYETSVITTDEYCLRGTLGYNNSVFYDECRFSITDADDDKIKYYINAEDIKTIAVKVKGD